MVFDAPSFWEYNQQSAVGGKRIADSRQLSADSRQRSLPTYESTKKAPFGRVLFLYLFHIPSFTRP